MQKVKIVSWNINGIRSMYKKGLVDFIYGQEADIYCFQETKATSKQIPVQLREISGYYSYYSSPIKKGYSGVAVYSRIQPKKAGYSMGISRFDDEGRVIILDLEGFVLLNVYFPNGGASQARLDYKMDFYDHFLRFINELRDEGKIVIFCGDVNTAHKEIDLARPKANEKNTGFLPQERAWIDRVIGSGYLDTFRAFNTEGGKYSWWDYKTRARERNVGWRLDYFFAADDLKNNLQGSYMLDDIMGSDHCPVVLELEI
ncbi:MAG: exodeoxyribonuclease III [Actinomycetia bacterium]|nr:exodeoxyribonuclease III [Actinomycetes bacterium]